MLGIDPGTRVTGYGCIATPPTLGGRPGIVEAGVFRLCPSGGPTPELAARLVELERDLDDLLARTTPSLVCIEALFSNPRHPGTVITMAHARGVILLAIRRAGVELVELPPAEVKRAAAGSGRATKPQMQASVQRLFGLDERPSPSDIADALAVAWCGAARHGAGAMRRG